MKKLLSGILFIIAIMFMFQPLVEAQSLNVLGCATLSNSDRDYYYLDLWKVGEFDSITVGMYASGELDVDSLRINGGVYFQNVRYAGSDVSVTGYEALTGGDTAHDINIADGATTISQVIATLTANECQGYNKLQFIVVAAASGNDATDTGQKYILYYKVYKPITYSKME